MFSKISLTAIWSDHWATLYDEDTQRPSTGDKILFAGVPIAAGFVVLVGQIPIGSSLVDTLITSLSIFAGLLFNLMMLIFGLAEKVDFKAVDVKDNLAEVRRLSDRLKALREAYANTSFSIVAALVAIFFLVLAKFATPSEDPTAVQAALEAIAGKPTHWPAIIAGACSVSTVTLFILTLLMILSRVHSIFRDEVRTKTAPPRPTPKRERIV